MREEDALAVVYSCALGGRRVRRMSSLCTDLAVLLQGPAHIGRYCARAHNGMWKRRAGVGIRQPERNGHAKITKPTAKGTSQSASAMLRQPITLCTPGHASTQ